MRLDFLFFFYDDYTDVQRDWCLSEKDKLMGTGCIASLGRTSESNICSSSPPPNHDIILYSSVSVFKFSHSVSKSVCTCSHTLTPWKVLVLLLTLIRRRCMSYIVPFIVHTFPWNQEVDSNYYSWDGLNLCSPSPDYKLASYLEIEIGCEYCRKLKKKDEKVCPPQVIFNLTSRCVVHWPAALKVS